MNLDIFDKDIEASVTIIFNRVINNIGLIDKHFTKFESYTPTIEITKLNNEINRMLEKRDSNSDEIKKSIFKCASLKYDCCQLETTKEMTHRLKAEFEKVKTIDGFPYSLFENTVSKIVIGDDRTLLIEFKNRITVSEKITKGSKKND